MKACDTGGNWDLVIRPRRGFWETGLRELWEYRDLLSLFIKRDIAVVYKQTILGPLWYFISPLLTMMVYIVVFSNIAQIPTDGVPPPLFYLAGIVMWNYFHECFLQTSDLFRQNAMLFGKVYFPRLIIPISKVISVLLLFLIQSCLLMLLIAYYMVSGAGVRPGPALVLIPVLLLLAGGIAAATGLILSALTAKYRDLRFLVVTGVQLLMYATPVIYPINLVPLQFRALIEWNPLTHVFEAFRLAVLAHGNMSYTGLLYAFVVMVMMVSAGVLIFSRTERTFADTV